MIPVASVENRDNKLVDSPEKPSRGAARFPSERALVRQAVSQSTWYGSDAGDDLGVVTELETPNGIVDIAFFRLRKDWRNHAVIGSFPSRWAYAFHKIPYRRRFSINNVALLAGTSQRRARSAVLEFEHLGLCKLGKDGQHWYKIRQPRMAIHELISVEAKLRDWRRALDQATRYLYYSDQAWVLLDDTSVQTARQIINDFEFRNVGLASISTAGVVTKYFLPEKSEMIRTHDRWVVNSELLKHII